MVSVFLLWQVLFCFDERVIVVLGFCLFSEEELNVGWVGKGG